MTMRLAGIVLFMAVLVCGCGHSKEELPTYAVSGTVNLDGAPLAEGEIYFVTKETGQIDIVPVKDGKFEGEAKAGSRRVEIRAYNIETSKPPADMPDLKMEPSKTNYLPAKYNTDSTLTADVSADKPNEFNFDLASK